MKISLPVLLPCYPCPHESSCCAQGTTLTPEEAHVLREEFGPDAVVYLDQEELVARGWFTGLTPEEIEAYLGEARGIWATTVQDGGKCWFLLGNACAIHKHPSYPVTCRKFPWEDPHLPELPAAWDADLCPEMGVTPRLSRTPGAS